MGFRRHSRNTIHVVYFWGALGTSTLEMMHQGVKYKNVLFLLFLDTFYHLLVTFFSPRFPQDFPKISSRFPQDFPKISPRFPQNFLKISSRFPRDCPQISPRIHRTFLKISPRLPLHFSYNSPKFPQDFPKIFPWSALVCPGLSWSLLV